MSYSSYAASTSSSSLRSVVSSNTTSSSSLNSHATHTSHASHASHGDDAHASVASGMGSSSTNEFTNTQSGSIDFMRMRHKRMMGTVKSKPPQRVSTSSSSSSGGGNNAFTPAQPVRLGAGANSALSSARRTQMTTGGHGSSSAFKPGRPMPIMSSIMPTPETTKTREWRKADSSHLAAASYSERRRAMHREEEERQHKLETVPDALEASPVLRPRAQQPVLEERTPQVQQQQHRVLASSSHHHVQPSPIPEESSHFSSASNTGVSSRSTGNRMSNTSALASAAALAALANAGGNENDVLLVNGNPYSILKKIGKGGSSVVYEVFDRDRQLRAIKKVDLSDADEACAAGYINEIHMLERLQGHHRIIRLFEYEHVEDTLFVVMERGDTDLASLLKKMSTISDLQRKFYWAEMLEAVQVIHEAGIIHSDLKPANFLMVAGSLKLIDFGIATSVQSDKTSVIKDNQFGTFNFMSPEALQDLSTDEDEEDEEANGESHKPKIKISFKTDVWSLGCILYHLTYRKLPFGDFKQPWKKLEAIVDPNYAIKYPASAGADPLLVKTIQRCLVRDPAQRASVEELLAHEYVTAATNKSAKAAPTGKENLDKLLDSLVGKLTPTTFKKVTQAWTAENKGGDQDAARRLDIN